MPDWFPKVASHLLTGVILVLVLQRMVKKTAVLKKDGPGMILGYSRWFAGLGCVVFSLFAFLGGYSAYHRTDGWEIILIVSGFFCLGGAFIFLYAFFTKIEIDDNKIVSRVFWRKPVTLNWLEVKKVDFIWTKHFRLESYDGRRVYIDMMMGGLSSFLAMIAKRLSIEKYLVGMRVYWKVTQSYQKSVGSVLAVPAADLAMVTSSIEAKNVKGLLEKIAVRVQEGMGTKAIEEILGQLSKPKPDQSIYLTKQVLFEGMPVNLFLFFFLQKDGRFLLNFFAPKKLAEFIKADMQRSGAVNVSLELDKVEDEDEVEDAQ